MTDPERQLIEGLASRIQNAPAPQIDRDADDLIRRGIGSRPDALYVLTQTVLIQEMALNQAKQQLDDLRRQQAPTSFLGTQAPPPPPPPQQYGGGYRGSSYQTGIAPQTPPPLPPQYEQPAPQSRFSGFLQNAAQTAAGVVAGEVAFSALSSLFGHHGYGGYGGGFFEGGAPISPVSETIINNNYYEDDHSRHDTYEAADSSNNDDSNNYQDVSGDDQSDDSSYDDGSGSTDV